MKSIETIKYDTFMQYKSEKTKSQPKLDFFCFVFIIPFLGFSDWNKGK